MNRHPDGSFDDEELVREGGVFVGRHGGREIGPDERERPHGDYAEDPGADDGVPGTRDDMPYDYGVEIPEAADHVLSGPDDVHAGFGDMGATEAPPDGDENELGWPEERELRLRQRALVEEAEAEDAHLGGLEGMDPGHLAESMAEGAEEPLQEAPEGTSAAGAG